MKFICAIISAILINFALSEILAKSFLQDEIKIKVNFSPVLDDFIISNFNLTQKTTEYKTSNGRELDLDEYIENLPFDFAQYLIVNKKFPSQLDFFADDLSLIDDNSQTISIREKDFKFAEIPLYILFESAPKMLILNYPDAFLKFENEAEFVSLKTLKKDEILSSKLNLALKNSGFKFPLKGYFSNPSSRKAFDEGAFLFDSYGYMFHLKQIRDQFIIYKTKIYAKSVKFIKVDENPRREFYAIAWFKNEQNENSLGLISYENYEFVKLPSSDLLDDDDEINLEITPLHKILTFKNKKRLKTEVLNPDFTPYKHIEIPLSKRDKKYNKFLFFAPLNLIIEDGKYVLKFDEFSAMALVLGFCFGLFLLLLKRGFLSFLMALFFGIGGVISALIWGKK